MNLPAARPARRRWPQRAMAGVWLVLGLTLAFGGRHDAKIEPERRAAAPTKNDATGVAPAQPPPAGQTAPFASVEEGRPSRRDDSCPADMVLVSGSYCPEVEHRCRRWLDEQSLPFARCADYEPLARCKAPRVSLRFCIDRYEYTEAGAALPRNHASFVSAQATCSALGKRVCAEREWVFACEGEEMRPYPYGWSRLPVCNQDRDDLYENNPRRQILKDNRSAAGAHPDCVSPFGVYDLAGNLDEPVVREGYSQYPFRNALKGGWWMAARNRCRPSTTAHDDHYKDIQVGIRCCRDAKPQRGSIATDTSLP